MKPRRVLNFCAVYGLLLALCVIVPTGSGRALAQDVSDVDVERLSDKQMRQLLNWMESDSREIGKQAAELEQRSRALRDELNIRLAQNDTGTPGGSNGATSGGTKGLAVTLEFKDGETLRFSQDQAKCFEDWVGRTFTQKNCRADNGFWHVSFRPDTTSERIEVVIELGHVTSDEGDTFIGEPYTFTLTQDGQTIATESVPLHFWGGRWRWQSEERPILKTCEELRSDPFLPRLEKGRTGQRPRKPNYSGPFTEPEFERGMGNTGERPDIGVVSGWTAHCLMDKGIDEQDLIELAADYSAAPVHHFRLENGKMLDLRDPAYKNRDYHYNTKGRPNYIAPGWGNPKKNTNYIKRDSAHHPSLFYVPYLLTEDPFWLEELQYVTQSHMLWSGYRRGSNETGKFLLIAKDQVRSWAWVYRDVFHAHYLTPDNAPDWLLPKAYYDKLLEDALVYLNFVMTDSGNSTESILRQRFNIMWSNSGWLTAIWMQDFSLSVFGLAVQAGYEDFRPWFEWLLVSAKERTADNGWDRRVPSFYNVDNRKMDFSKANNWSELFAVYQEANSSRFSKPINKWPEGSYWEDRGKYSGYAEYVYGGLVVAEWLGYDVKENLDYLEAARDGKEKKGADKTYDKWSFQR